MTASYFGFDGPFASSIEAGTGMPSSRPASWPAASFRRLRSAAITASYSYATCNAVGFFSRAIIPDTVALRLAFFLSGRGILANVSAVYFENLPASC